MKFWNVVGRRLPCGKCFNITNSSDTIRFPLLRTWMAHPYNKTSWDNREVAQSKREHERERQQKHVIIAHVPYMYRHRRVILNRLTLTFAFTYDVHNLSSISSQQGLRQDLKVWVCKFFKNGCANLRICVQSIGDVEKNLVFFFTFFLQMWPGVQKHTRVAGCLSPCLSGGTHK